MVDAPREEGGAPKLPPVRQDDPTDVSAIVEDDAHDAGAHEPELDPRRAYEVLEIRTPLEEFESYVRARIDTLSRLGETDKAELASQALELGRRALARVTGTTLSAPDRGGTERPR